MKGREIGIKQVTLKQHGYTYQAWEVHGYRPDGTRIRIRCKSEDEARIRKSEEETKAINSERSARFIQTRLTALQLSEAESCFDRLAPKYSLTEAVDYFLRHYHAPEFKIPIGGAFTQFQAAMDGTVRDRTLVGVKSTLGQFELFTNNTNVHEITTATVEAFLNSLRGRNGTDKATRRTWNASRGILHRFFGWCVSRRYISTNPVSDTKRYKIAADHIDVLPLEVCQKLMGYVAQFKGGKLAPYFAIALFGGVRPGPNGELAKLAKNPELVSPENRSIRITAAISKIGKPRQIKIRPNLIRWLQRYPGDILPVNYYRDIAAIRKKFALSHDVLRHTFISAHVMAFGSFAETAIEAGNSESIIREHYFNVITRAKAKAFWRIEPS
jgi:integrase